MNDLGTEIEAAALATPGVLALYRTGSMLANAVTAAAEQLMRPASAPTRVVVTTSDGVTRVDIAVGVGAGTPAAETAQAVRERVEALLIARDLPHPFIRLTVVHVADGQPLTGAAVSSPSALA